MRVPNDPSGQPSPTLTPRRSILSSHGCLYCVGAHLDRLLDFYEASESDKRAFVEQVATRYSDHGKRMPPVEFMRELYHLLGATFPNQAPFWEPKRRMNDRALELNSLLKARVQICSDSFEASLRLALAGTAIDFLRDSDEEVWGRVDSFLQGGCAVDHSKQLRRALRGAARVLYLGDKAGEIVMDRLFIRRITGCRVTYVVNCTGAGLAASGQDADYVDMRICAEVLDNGCHGPYTLVQHGSPRFAKAWEEADVIIAKGQGNLEAMYPMQDARVYTLFTCQCHVVSQLLGLAVGQSAVVHLESRLAEMGTKGNLTE